MDTEHLFVVACCRQIVSVFVTLLKLKLLFWLFFLNWTALL